MINAKLRKMNKTKIELFVIDIVKSKRIERNFSQNELADLLGVSSGFIGRAESPKYSTKYNLNHINKFALILIVILKNFYQ